MVHSDDSPAMGAVRWMLFARQQAEIMGIVEH
jgi:hypothetical protein